jgi:hypothetical protein
MRARLAVGVMAGLLLAGPAAAQSAGADGEGGPADAVPADAVPAELARVREGTSEWGAAIGYGAGVTLLDSKGGQRYALPMLSWGRVLTGPRGPSWFRGRFEWAFEVVPFFAQHAPEAAYGAGISPLVWRWNFQERGVVAPFGEVGGGGLWTTEPVPAGTTRTNFTVHMSAGVRVFGAGRDALVAAYRFDHISNGNRLARNPGVNAHMVVLGWSRVQTGRAAPRQGTGTRSTSRPDAASKSTSAFW